MKSFVIVLIISWLSNGSLFAQTKKATIQKLDSLLQLVDTLPLEEKGAVYFELLRVEFSVTDRFEEVVQNVFEYAETNGIDSLKALAAQRSALRLINKGEHALARERLQISEDYFIQFNSERYKRLLVTTLVLKGYNLNRQNYVTEALKVFLQALPIAKEIKDLKRINNLHNRIINLYVAQEDYTKAFHYVDLITKSCAGREKKKCPFYLISQQTKANIYLAKNELDSARQVINDYFPLLPRQSMNSMLMNAYTAMGRLKRKEQQWEMALQYLDSARVFATTMNRTKAGASIFSEIAETQRLIDDTNAEISALQQQRDIAHQNNFPKIEMNALDRLREIAEERADYPTAYRYGQEWRMIRDSFNQIERANILKRHDELIAQHEQEEHMQLLENEQIVQRSWNNRLLFLLLFALLIIAFAIYFLRVRRRLNASLQQKNQLLNQAVQDRELLIREVHHRVKNNLQIITSLLNLQLRHVTHPAARAALTDGRNRVRSISLLHQDLYQESKLKGVDTHVYLTNIVHNLQYAFRDEEVNVQTEIDKIIVDEEQMVLVGLIINEALTNAYKHAFAETKEPKIELTFLAQQEQLNLRIADNGKGFDPATATRQRQSFGLQLIEDMARKLKAKISLQSDIKGTILILEIPNVEPSSQ